MRTRTTLLLMLLWPAGLLGQERMMRADSAWVRGDQEAAFRIYEELLARDSTTVTALHRMALVHSWEARYDRSLALLDRALDLAPDYTPAMVDRARVLGLQGRYDEALSILDRVLAGQPDDEGALEVKASVAFWAGRYDISLGAYERLLRRARDPSPFRMPYARVLVAVEL